MVSASHSPGLKINCYCILGAIVNMNSFFGRLCHSPIPGLAAALVALALSSPPSAARSMTRLRLVT